MRLPDPARSRVVLIGTARFEDDELVDLPSVPANLTDLELRLTGPFERIRTIADPDNAGAVGMLVAEEAKAAEDTLLVYYAGHGLVDQDGALHLGVTTTKPGHVNYTAMPLEYLRRAFAESPAANRVLILDCCFSGRATQAMSEPNSLVSGQIDIEGTYTLVSSPPNQPSQAPEGARHTAFTGELLNALVRGLPSEDEFITLDAMYLHLARTLSARGLPKPQRRGTGTAGQLALVRNRLQSSPDRQPPLTPAVLSNAEFVVVTAQLPFELDGQADGRPRWIPRPGGLRAALGLQPPQDPGNAGDGGTDTWVRRTNAWVGWSGAADRPQESFDDNGTTMLPVALSEDEVRRCLAGFANATIWPLYHDAVRRPVIDRVWWDAFVGVNKRFAETAAAAAAERASVWVHDYQLQLVPAMLRELRPDLRIGFFMDIPFPPFELFMQLPWRTAILRGLLGADIVGFHQARSASNFLSLAANALGFNANKISVDVHDRRVRVAAFPASIDSSAIDRTARSSAIIERARHIRSELGNPRTVILGAQRLGHVQGMDDLDSVLGINHRLRALYELLEEGRVDPDELVAVEIIEFTTRSDSEIYLQLGGGIENTVTRINARFAPVRRPVVHYLQRAMGTEELIAFYHAADVLTVTPMRDGMNLVAKEYVASRHDLGGALVLSEFSGAAAELSSAYLANTYSIDSVKDAMHAAITGDPPEQRRRMRAMRRQVLTHDSDRWTGAFRSAIDLHSDTTS